MNNPRLNTNHLSGQNSSMTSTALVWLEQFLSFNNHSFLLQQNTLEKCNANKQHRKYR